MSAAVQPRGVVDSLSAGFALVARRPGLMALPLLLEVLYWLAPGVSAAPLVRRVADSLLQPLLATAATPDDAVAFTAQASLATELGSQVNLLGLLGWLVPTLLGASADTNLYQRTVVVATWPHLLLVGAALLAGGVVVGAGYLAPIAQVVREGRVDPGVVARRLRPVALRLGGYLLVVALLLGGLLAALGVALAVASALGTAFVGLVLGLGVGGLLLLRLYLLFGEEALVISDVGPLRAVEASLRVVARSFWPVLGLYLVTTTITWGLNLIWAGVLAHPLGLMAAVAGNAFVGTGIVTALMVYYKDRSPFSPDLARGAAAQDRLSRPPP